MAKAVRSTSAASPSSRNTLGIAAITSDASSNKRLARADAANNRSRCGMRLVVSASSAATRNASASASSSAGMEVTDITAPANSAQHANESALLGNITRRKIIARHHNEVAGSGSYRSVT